MSAIAGARELTLRANGLSFTAYEWGEGSLVLLLHGFPDTPATWRHLGPVLADAGFRAVAVTSRGYESSSQPADGDYSLPALASDVLGWMDACGAETAHLVGHDWGSSILHAATAAAPGRAQSLTALAVPHPAGFGATVMNDFDQMARSWYVFLFQLPGFADGLLAQLDGAFVEHLWRIWSPGWSVPQADLAAVRAAFAAPGVVEAALRYYRTGFDSAHPRLAEAQKLLSAPILTRTLGLSGVHDGCVSPDVFRRAMAIMPFSPAPVIEVVHDAGHFLHLERPDAVNPRIVRWLTTGR